MRVTAALRLGKQNQLGPRTKERVRKALEQALSDRSSSVRASAAAGLQRLGDRRALPALRRARQRATASGSDSVLRQIDQAMSALVKSEFRPQYLVELGKVRVSSRVRNQALNRHLKRVARRNLGQLPGVVLKEQASADSSKLPSLVFDGTLRKLHERQEGDAYAISARVDFLISKLPGHVIKGRISGGATVHGGPSAPTSRAELRRLRREAVSAATQSALENAQQAMYAAVR